ncbi:MAG: hypothetical protein QOE41_349, partial [Mycobacterium sp.]|nr:hypothetical protein [Mycobacterium sp.]
LRACPALSSSLIENLLLTSAETRGEFALDDEAGVPPERQIKPL